MGFKWNKESYASDYFAILYKFAIELIKKGFAYIDNQSKYIIQSQRKTSFEIGINSINRNRSIDENIKLFEKMKNGFFKEGTCVLRAKINMNSSNMNMRDPIMYRILYKKHHKTGSKWCIYPTYDWTHGQCDYIEQISHSLCSLEFENKKPLYNWFLDKIPYNKKKIKPKQIEFSRLNISNTITSKRKIKYLIEKNIIESWDDPRILTIQGLRKKGYTSNSLKNFIHKIGITKRNNIIDTSSLEYYIRKDLNKISSRLMVVLHPIKLIIDNYPSDNVEWIKIKNNPEDPHSKYRKVPFSKTLYIEKTDFIEKINEKNFFRLYIGNKVRLKGAYIIKANLVKKDYKGKIKEIHCIYYPDSKSGTKKIVNKKMIVKSTLHWVSTKYYFPVEVNLYDILFLKNENNINDKNNFYKYINPKSKNKIIAKAEPHIKESKVGDHLQFQRIGYFYVEKIYKNKIIVNETVSIKNKWNKNK